MVGGGEGIHGNMHVFCAFMFKINMKAQNMQFRVFSPFSASFYPHYTFYKGNGSIVPRLISACCSYCKPQERINTFSPPATE